MYTLAIGPELRVTGWRGLVGLVGFVVEGGLVGLGLDWL